MDEESNFRQPHLKMVAFVYYSQTAQLDWMVTDLFEHLNPRAEQVFVKEKLVTASNCGGK